MDGNAQPLVGRRATIAFVAKVTTELDWLMGHLGIKQNDVVNRSVTVYALVEREIAKGKKMAFISDDGTIETVNII